MFEPKELYHVYRPSGFVGTMSLEAARLCSGRDPQVLIEPVGQTPSWQAKKVSEATERRLALHRGWIQNEKRREKSEFILGLLSLLAFLLVLIGTVGKLL